MVPTPPCYVSDVSPLRAWGAAAFRRLPPVIRRDARIEALQHELTSKKQQVLRLREELSSHRRQVRRLQGEVRGQRATCDALTAELRALEEELAQRSEELSAAISRQVQPSHRVALAETWRERFAAESNGGLDDCLAFDHKLMSYAFARSHEVSIPRLFGRWQSIDDLDLVGLVAQPQVLKSAYGATAQGVVATNDLWDLRAAIETWRGLLQPSPPTGKARIAPPFFTEERLRAPSDGPLIDIKVYAFYGEIGLVMLVAPENFRHRGTVRTRFISKDGADLGPLSGDSRHDAEIDVPWRLDQIVDTSRTLSLALRRPFVRLDFYQEEDRVLLGEITPWPGQGRVFEPGFDTALGRDWDLARMRLRSDLLKGISPRIEWGPGSRQLEFEQAPPWHPREVRPSDGTRPPEGPS